MATKHPYTAINQHALDWLDMMVSFNSLLDPCRSVVMLQHRYHYTEPKLGYVVPMHRKPNRGLKRESTLLMQHLNFLDEAHLQQGYAYYAYPDFPRKLLNIVSVLQKANLINGYDVDENGFVNYCDDEEE